MCVLSHPGGLPLTSLSIPLPPPPISGSEHLRIGLLRSKSPERRSNLPEALARSGADSVQCPSGRSDKPFLAILPFGISTFCTGPHQAGAYPTSPSNPRRECFLLHQEKLGRSRGLHRGETLRERGNGGGRGGVSAAGPVEISRLPLAVERLWGGTGRGRSKSIRGDRGCPVQPQDHLLTREVLFLARMPSPGLLSPKGQGHQKHPKAV